MSAPEQATEGGASSAGSQTGPLVSITVDGTPRDIRRGHETVAQIKTVGQVPLAYDLDEVIDGKLTPLPDDGSVVIKGGEVFLSHPKTGQSS